VGSPETFDAYVAARYAALLRTAYLLTGNHHDAEDLVQTALVKAVGVWRRIEDRPDAYVRRILVNENVSRWRRHRGREVLTDRTPDAVVPDPGPEALAMREALATLAPRQRAVVVLRYYEDLTERETAEVLGVAVGTVKSQARDALARLRALSGSAQADAARAGGPGAPALRATHALGDADLLGPGGAVGVGGVPLAAERAPGPGAELQAAEVAVAGVDVPAATGLAVGQPVPGAHGRGAGGGGRGDRQQAGEQQG
jgi:RNA polymerase sigma-70 factor (sigma-E family)